MRSNCCLVKVGRYSSHIRKDLAEQEDDGNQPDASAPSR